MIIDLPYIHCYVRGKFVSDSPLDIECYIYSVTCIMGRPLLFNVHTEHGAIFGRLPIHAFTTIPELKSTYSLEELQPWSCIGHRAQVISHAYLKDYEVEVRTLDTVGTYMFTIDQFDGGYSEDPEQHKTFNVVELENGQLGAFPNNFLLLKDNHFTNTDMIKYQRQTKYWRTN